MSHRIRHLLIATILIPIGIGTKLYPGPGSTWLGDNFGGVIYVMFWSFLALAVRPAWGMVRVATVVLACTTALEFLQLWHPTWLEAIRATVSGRALLGGVFSWIDIPYYVLGAVAAVALTRWVLTDPAVGREP